MPLISHPYLLLLTFAKKVEAPNVHQSYVQLSLLFSKPSGTKGINSESRTYTHLKITLLQANLISYNGKYNGFQNGYPDFYFSI